MNKKIIFASFFAVILLLVPLNTIADTSVKQAPIKPTLLEESIKMQLSEDEINHLNNIVENIEDTDEQNQAKAIINQIIDEEGNLDFEEFGLVLEAYLITEDQDDIQIDPIALDKIISMEGERDLSAIEDLLNNFMEYILDRLGWSYVLVTKASNLYSDVQALLSDTSLPRQILTDLQDALHWIGNVVELSVLLLIQTRWWQFAQKWAYRIELFTSLMAAISSIQAVATNLGILVGDIQRFVTDATDFITWFNEEPWTNPIHIHGDVLNRDGTTLTPISGVEVTCRGQSVTTDEEGKFDFSVTISDTSSSLPPGNLYGMHLCSITAEKEGEFSKTTEPAELTYCFSDGGVYWLFVVKDSGGSREKTPLNTFADRLQNIFNSIFEKLDENLFRLINQFRQQIQQLSA